MRLLSTRKPVFCVPQGRCGLVHSDEHKCLVRMAMGVPVRTQSNRTPEQRHHKFVSGAGRWASSLAHGKAVRSISWLPEDPILVRVVVVTLLAFECLRVGHMADGGGARSSKTLTSGSSATCPTSWALRASFFRMLAPEPDPSNASRSDVDTLVSRFSYAR